jgi:hypothetical protein
MPLSSSHGCVAATNQAPKARTRRTHSATRPPSPQICAASTLATACSNAVDTALLYLCGFPAPPWSTSSRARVASGWRSPPARRPHARSSNSYDWAVRPDHRGVRGAARNQRSQRPLHVDLGARSQAFGCGALGVHRGDATRIALIGGGGCYTGEPRPRRGSSRCPQFRCAHRAPACPDCLP